MACASAYDMAREGREIILDNQAVVKATPTKWKGIVKDQDYRDMGYQNATTKDLTVHRTPRRWDLVQAPMYQGTIESYTLANMGNNLPMETPPPTPRKLSFSIRKRVQLDKQESMKEGTHKAYVSCCFNGVVPPQ